MKFLFPIFVPLFVPIADIDIDFRSAIPKTLTTNTDCNMDLRTGHVEACLNMFDLRPVEKDPFE